VRDGFHFHALIRTDHDPKELKEWYERHWGRAQIIDNHQKRRLAASVYCSKYITKRLTDYDFYFADDIKKRDQSHIAFTQAPLNGADTPGT